MVRFSSHLLHSRFNPLTVCVLCALRAVKQQRPRYLEPGFRDVGAAAPKRIGQPAGIPLKAAHDAAGFELNPALEQLRSYKLKELSLFPPSSSEHNRLRQVIRATPDSRTWARSEVSLSSKIW